MNTATGQPLSPAAGHSPAALHVLDHDDTVAIALRDLPAGKRISTPDGRILVITGDVPQGHKVALADVSVGSVVRKYAHVIGVATAPITAGDHVHSHNLAFSAHEGSSADDAAGEPLGPLELPDRRTFLGIRRSDGSVGTRNFIAVLSSVNCSATVCRTIAARAEASGLLDEFPGLDGVVALTHDQGCGHVAQGQGLAMLRRTLAGYAQHPNIGGVVMIGLGCQMNQMEHLLEGITFRPEVPVVSFTVQEQGGTKRAIARGLEAVREMAPTVTDVTRVEVPVSELVVGLNCGGSDAWSAVTANPALGHASDLIVAQGGRTVLAETPEIYGAEDLLVRRAASPAVARDLLDVIGWWEEYTAADGGGSMDNNPSPGNKAGGITTILEKSLGSVAKGGHAPLMAVHRYAEPISARGFSFMDTPGYDPVSVTGLIAGGCTMVCFTTGRGSAIGTRPAPTLKLSTTSDLFRRMGDDMDLDCGSIVEQGRSIESVGLDIYHRILDVASGTPTKSEELGYGDNEFVPWHVGAVT
ncbi:altronate hydrolase [Raineyella antarctica]|uniref:Altronate hydrolase n=1 Tax=Raineyella antarctica TaxID=1577474 RepID=A0A1G6HI64_9ACTN|nr:altronate dehydratase family protein [Raineyella antarctica]SDB93136.1 altronate hydrolase [Raineyella antarctica]